MLGLDEGGFLGSTGVGGGCIMVSHCVVEDLFTY